MRLILLNTCMLFSLIHAVAPLSSYAQDLKISNIIGSAKIQHAQSKQWNQTSIGDQVKNNDIIETFFQTKLSIALGGGNVILIGSNSKVLFNFGTDENPVLNITVFSGGLFIKVVDGSEINIFTNNGVAQTTSGSVSTVVESKTGFTGFQILGGSATVRNIAQQNTRTLSAGHTTIIRQGKAPTASLYITLKHISVLKHFFGDEYIESELKASNIRPTESSSTANRLSFSKSYEAQRKQTTNDGMYKKLFSLNTIYGAIIEDRVKHSRAFNPIPAPSHVSDQGFSTSFQTRLSFGGAQVYPAFILTPSFGTKQIHAAIRIPVSRGYTGMGLYFSGLSGILDKIGYFTVGKPSDTASYLHIGPLQDFSMNHGLVVSEFSNNNPYSALHPLGVSFNLKKNHLSAGGFLADLSDPTIGGLRVGFGSSMSELYGGYYFDANQYNQSVQNSDVRYAEFSDPHATSAIPSPDSVKASAHVYELGLQTRVVDVPEVQAGISFDFAQKIIESRTDGFVTRGPSLFAEWSWMRASVGFTIESGRLISPQFHRFYLSNRLRMQQSDQEVVVTTQNNMLSTRRKTSGIHLFYGASPFRGTSAEFTYKQDFSTQNAFSDTSLASKNNYSFCLSFSINDDFFSPIHYARIYLRQDHGGYYPSAARFFASWGLQTGFEIHTAPLFRGLNLHLSGDFYYLDIDPHSSQSRFNNNIDAGDFVFDLLFGGRWRF